MGNVSCKQFKLSFVACSLQDIFKMVLMLEAKESHSYHTINYFNKPTLLCPLEAKKEEPKK